MTHSSPSLRADVFRLARSLPASGSDMPIDHVDSPARIPGRNACCWSARPKAISVGPICRSANHMAAIGAPAAISSSPMIRRSIGGRPPPPNSSGHVSPIQPSAASSLANSDENPLIHESLVRPNRATASAATSRACCAQRHLLRRPGEVHLARSYGQPASGPVSSPG